MGVGNLLVSRPVGAGSPRPTQWLQRRVRLPGRCLWGRPRRPPQGVTVRAQPLAPCTLVAGGVIGLAAAPHLAEAAGVAATFAWSGALGVAWAAGGAALLAAGGLTAAPLAERQGADEATAAAAARQQQEHGQPVQRGPRKGQPAVRLLGMQLTRRGAAQVAVLCAAHAAIGWGFFLMQACPGAGRVQRAAALPFPPGARSQLHACCSPPAAQGLRLAASGTAWSRRVVAALRHSPHPPRPGPQNWIPLYLSSLGGTAPSAAGALSALPWLAAAATGVAAGGLADRCARAGSGGSRMQGWA